MNPSLQNLGPESHGVGSGQWPSIEINRILAAVDFSPASSRGLACAASLAERFGSRIDLLYVIEPPVLPEWGYAHLEFRESKLRLAAEEKLGRFPAECGLDSRLVRSAKVRSGEAEFEICQAAVDENSDLVVLAGHGLGGLKHALVGGACEGVVRRASRPVLAVNERAAPGKDLVSFAPKRIVVATDFSGASRKAFPYAIALARKFGAALTLVYVVPSHLPAEVSHLGIVLAEKQMLAEAVEKLPLFRQAEMDPHLCVETLVLNGSPAREICGTAETRGADLIVISTHGHTGLKRFALGSVAEAVVRHATCPVLVVREREHDFVHPHLV